MDFVLGTGMGTYILHAQAKGIGFATNIEAEARAIQEALNVSTKKSYRNLVIETDSLTLHNIILRIWRVPWKITDIMKEMCLQKAKIKQSDGRFFSY